MEDILKDGKFYIVPPFQRNYSWEMEQITDFWTDLMALYDTDDEYFIGSMVVTPQDKTKIKILDGQQRLATVLLFLAALKDVLKQSNPEGAEDWAEDIQNIIFTRDTPSRVKNQKLELNKEDKEYFFNNDFTIFLSLSIISEYTISAPYQIYIF